MQQLRFLITELTMGKDVTELRKQSLRSATNTLLFVIATYLIANALGTAMTVAEFCYPGECGRPPPSPPGVATGWVRARPPRLHFCWAAHLRPLAKVGESGRPTFSPG